MSDGLVRYRFLSVVGEGGFGKVYRARLETSEGFHKDVAVKVLSDPDPPKSLLQRFRDEAKILGLVRDRAIVGAEPPIKVGDRWAVVMEYVDGVSLGSLIGESGMEPGVAVEIVGEAARALHNAFHMQGPDGPLQLLHRDIKPDNVQVTPSGDVRILDFGIARANFSAREFRTRHSLGGTPGYIAPERLQGVELPVGDVFSLGVVLHEAVTGTRPKYPPTVQWEGNNGETTPFPAERDTTGVLLTDEEIPEAVLADPHKMEVLRLAGWMRAEEPEERPSARQVEDACRKLRLKLPPPYLREWAESRVPHRNEIAPDNMIGQVLTTSMPSSVFVDPNVTPLSLPATYTQQAQSNTPGLAITALISGLSAVVVGLIGAGAIVVVGIVLWVVLQPPAPGVEAPGTGTAPTVADVPAPEPLAPVVPTPEPRVIVVDPAPATVRPAPASPSPQPREIVVGDQEPDAPPDAPSPPTAPVPTRAAPTGLVVVATVPSGATVMEKGKVLEKTGRGYMLKPGIHTLSIRSPNGETTTLPVSVVKDQTIEICYDFTANAKCASQ